MLVLGLLLLVTSALSGWLHGTVLSISVLSLAVGAGLSLWGVLDVQPDTPGLIEVIELALVLTLFSDGLTVERELLQERWRDPALRARRSRCRSRSLLIALAGKLLFAELTWAEALLLGAVLAPTDPVVTSSVVSSPRVPAAVRHSLNLESGPQRRPRAAVRARLHRARLPRRRRRNVGARDRRRVRRRRRHRRRRGARRRMAVAPTAGRRACTSATTASTRSRSR